MSNLTITEALAEIKTINKRIEKKRSNLTNIVYRQDVLKDPFQNEGGSPQILTRERQAIDDLDVRKVGIRRAIQEANANTNITVCGISKTIADWLVWRREVAPGTQAFLNQISNAIANVRREAMNKGFAVTQDEAQAPTDIVVNVNEQQLSQDIEKMEEILGTLDGQLSLKNATTFIEL